MSKDQRASRVLGSRFGPYRLKRLLGTGGMGEVYEAEHTVKEWSVALKLMSAEFSQDPEFRERMQREARITGQLREPHVVPIHDYGEIDGQLYLEMRLIRGNDLHALLKRSGPLPPPRAVAIVRQIASALEAAHAAGVMHRDVKPKNVLITGDDFAYLVDFGIAKAATDAGLTKIGNAVGSWHYMAPERLFGKPEAVTHSVDVYALGCLMYECLTGSPPYQGDMTALATAHMIEPIPRPSVTRPDIPDAFDAVIARGMAKSPEHRYATADDLAQAAQQALSAPDQHRATRIVEDSQRRARPANPPTLPQPQVAYQPQLLAKPATTNTMAIASLVTSLCGWLCGLPAIVGMILGVMAMRQTKRTGQSGHGIALAGVIVGAAMLVFVIVVLIVAIGSP